MTPMTQLSIDSATDDQLRSFARHTLQIEVADNAERPAIRSAIALAWPQNFILVAADAADASVQAQTRTVENPVGLRLTGTDGYDDPIAIFKIGQTDMPGGRDPVPVGVNGHTVVMQRLQEIRAPYRFYEALMNATREAIEMVPDESGRPGKHNVVTTEISNYPVQAISIPPPHVIAEWRARTAEVEMA